MHTASNKQLRVVTWVTQQQLSALTQEETEPILYGYGHQPSDNSNENMVQRMSTSNAYVKSVHKIHLSNSFEQLKNWEKSVHTQLTKREQGQICQANCLLCIDIPAVLIILFIPFKSPLHSYLLAWFTQCHLFLYHAMFSQRLSHVSFWKTSSSTDTYFSCRFPFR